MTKALELLEQKPSIEFRAAFARTTSMMAIENRDEPGKVYTVQEISELFDYLYCLMCEDMKKSPLVAAGQGSKKKQLTRIV